MFNPLPFPERKYRYPIDSFMYMGMEEGEGVEHACNGPKIAKETITQATYWQVRLASNFLATNSWLASTHHLQMYSIPHPTCKEKPNMRKWCSFDHYTMADNAWL